MPKNSLKNFTIEFHILGLGPQLRLWNLQNGIFTLKTSVDRRPNQRYNVEFSNFTSAVWRGPDTTPNVMMITSHS